MDRIFKNCHKSLKKERKFLKYFLIILNFIIVVEFLANICLYTSRANSDAFCDELDNFAQAHVVMDSQTGTIFHGKNIHQKLPMASTTKIMTAILAIENLDLEKCIKINKNAIGVEGSSIYLAQDKMYKIKDLIYGLMLRSGNDAAEALAYEISGSIDNFAKLMNDKAKSLNLNNTNFVNPHGLHDDSHYTTAFDLAKLTSYALKNPEFLKIVSSKMHIVESDEGVFYNKNKLLSNYDGANGVKTGYTTVSGKCLVSSAKRYGKQIVCVVLNCPNTWDCSKKLLDFAFAKYNIVTPIKKDQVIAEKDNVKLYINEDVSLAFLENEKMNIKFKIRKRNDLPNYIDKDSEIAYLDVYSNNCLLFSKKIYNIEKIILNKDKDKLNSLLIELKNGENQ